MEESHNSDQDVIFMREALKEAELAAKEDEVPVGCVITMENRIIARSHNIREKRQDPTGHAEIYAIKKAAEFMGSWRLTNTRLYVTLEPCVMCAGAIINARIPWVIYGADDPKAGACDSLFSILSDTRLNHQTRFHKGILKDECSEILKNFFQRKRKENA